MTEGEREREGDGREEEKEEKMMRVRGKVREETIREGKKMTGSR